jgi:hypothetical protein
VPTASTPTYTIHCDSRATEHDRTLRQDGRMLGSYSYSPATGNWFATVQKNVEKPHNWSLPTEEAARNFILDQHGIPADTTFWHGDNEAVLWDRCLELTRLRKLADKEPKLNEHDENRADAIRGALDQLRDAGIHQLDLLAATQLLHDHSIESGRDDAALRTIRLELERSI